MIKFFTERPLFTAAIFAVLFIIGLYSLARIPLDMFPNIYIPTISVITAYPGASAEDIETTVTKKVEDAMGTVPNVDELTSTSGENVSFVTVKFKWGTDLDAAAADMRDKLELIKSKLPEDANQPIVYKFDLSSMPVLYLGLSAEASYKNLNHIADRQIGDALRRIPGVGTVTIIGGLIRQINVDLDKNRLDAYGLSLNQVLGYIQAANLTLPAGSLKIGQLEYDIRVPGEYSSVDQVASTVVGNVQGRIVYLRDVARVSDNFAEQTGATRINGKAGLMIMVQKQSGANTVQVAKNVLAELDDLKKDIPADISISVIQDTSKFIRNSISNLTETLMYAFLFVFLTVFFFLRNIIGSVILSLTMPVALLTAFIFFYFAGYTINMISLASIIIAIGQVVDNGVVVLENIYRHRDEKKEPLKQAAIFGAGEVAGAVTASTTTNLVVFVPILLIQGFITFFFMQLAVTTTVVMASSLFSALTLIPVLSARILDTSKKYRLEGSLGQRLYKLTGAWLDWIDATYTKIITWTLAHRRLVLTTGVVIFFVSMPMFAFIGTEFFPDMDFGYFRGNVEMPPGTRWEETDKVMAQIEKYIQAQLPEVELYMVNSGSSGSGTMARMGGQQTGPNYGTILGKLVAKDKRKRTTDEIQHLISQEVSRYPGVVSISFSESGANSMTGNDRPITVEIYGYDLKQTDDLAELIKAKIADIPGTTDLSISRKKGSPEYWVRVDRAKASSLGLPMSDIALALRNSFYGNAITKYREAGEEYDIFVRLSEQDRRGLTDLRGILLTNRLGQAVPLANVATIEETTGPLEIDRKGQNRIVKVEGDNVGRSIGQIDRDINKVLDKIPLPPGVTVKMAGSAKQIEENFADLRVALVIGILLVFLVMAAQFESILSPLLIIFSIPFAMVGVVWAMFLTRTNFGLMPFIGLIMVVGIVVNNAIVLIDYTNITRARGVPLKEAVILSAGNRLRPILMTTAVTILGLIPVAVSHGEGSEMWTGMSWAVIGGLLASTLITLVIIPALYLVVESRLKGRRYYGREMK